MILNRKLNSPAEPLFDETRRSNAFFFYQNETLLYFSHNAVTRTNKWNPKSNKVNESNKCNSFRCK